MVDSWVERGADDYAQAIESELPSGAAWSRDPDKGLMKWVSGCAQIWGDVSVAAANLLTVESDPTQTIAMLPDWETAFGLPDACNDEVQTLATRRAALLNRLTIQGAQSRAFFLAVAEALGYQVTIYEYRPYMAGIGVCGETRPTSELRFTYAQCGVAICGVTPMCAIVTGGGDDWIWRIGTPNLRYYWRVGVQTTRLTWLRCGLGECGVDHMCEFGLATDLECLFRRWKPAHTYVIFDYSQVVVP